MAKCSVKDLRPGDQLELKVTCTLEDLTGIANGLGEHNGVRKLKTLKLKVLDGPWKAALGSAVVEETDRLDLVKRKRRTFKELLCALWYGKKGKRNGRK